MREVKYHTKNTYPYKIVKLSAATAFDVYFQINRFVVNLVKYTHVTCI